MPPPGAKRGQGMSGGRPTVAHCQRFASVVDVIHAALVVLTLGGSECGSQTVALAGNFVDAASIGRFVNALNRLRWYVVCICRGRTHWPLW